MLSSYLDPALFENLQLCFEIEIPSAEELLQGILVKFEKIKFPEIETFEDLVMENFKDEVKLQLLGTAPKKAIYGRAIYGESKYGEVYRYDESRYGYAYYDPVQVTMFIAQAMVRFFLNLKTVKAYSAFMEGSAEALNITPGLKSYIHNRMNIVASGFANSFVLGMAVLGISKLGEKEDDKAKIPVVLDDGSYVEVKFTTLDHLHCGFILGVTPLGYGVLLPERTVYKEPQPRCVEWTSKLATDTIRRFYATSLAVANYQRPEERRDWQKSERADQYMALQIIRRQVENMVEAALRGCGLTARELRLYKNAALQLATIRVKRHRWGYTAFRYMDDEELKKWWIEYWSRQGLNTALLERIWQVIAPCLRSLEEIKQRYSTQLSATRKLLSKYSKVWT